MRQRISEYHHVWKSWLCTFGGYGLLSAEQGAKKVNGATYAQSLLERPVESTKLGLTCHHSAVTAWWPLITRCALHWMAGPTRRAQPCCASHSSYKVNVHFCVVAPCPCHQHCWKFHCRTACCHSSHSGCRCMPSTPSGPTEKGDSPCQ